MNYAFRGSQTDLSCSLSDGLFMDDNEGDRERPRDIQQNDTQHNDTRHNDIQHDNEKRDTRQNAKRPNNVQYNVVMLNTANSLIAQCRYAESRCDESRGAQRIKTKRKELELILSTSQRIESKILIKKYLNYQYFNIFCL